MIVSSPIITGEYLVKLVPNNKPISITNIIIYLNNRLNNNVSILDLSYNNVDDISAIQLITYILEYIPSLIKLDISYNRIEFQNKILNKKIEELVNRSNFKMLKI